MIMIAVRDVVVTYMDRTPNDVHTADGKNSEKKRGFVYTVVSVVYYSSTFLRSTVLTFQEQDHFLRLLRRGGGCGEAPTTAVRGDD